MILNLPEQLAEFTGGARSFTYETGSPSRALHLLRSKYPLLDAMIFDGDGHARGSVVCALDGEIVELDDISAVELGHNIDLIVVSSGG